MDKLIELREVTAGYGNKIALRNVTLDVWKNDFLGIIGPNGGGKTTLLKVILGLLPPISGTIRFYDENVEVPSLKIGYLPQMSQIDKKFPISVREVISSGLSAEKPLFRPFNRSQRERVDEVIVQMGLEGQYLAVSLPVSFSVLHQVHRLLFPTVGRCLQKPI